MPETILVVEDEPSLQETLAYNLKKEGYTVEEAIAHANASAARWAVHDDEPDREDAQRGAASAQHDALGKAVFRFERHDGSLYPLSRGGRRRADERGSAWADRCLG
jgi:hypothetical protein